MVKTKSKEARRQAVLSTQEWRAKQREDGLKQIVIWVPKDTFQAYANKALKRRHKSAYDLIVDVITAHTPKVQK